ncbi:tyrosine-type recombinase/integrase [Nocardia thailandica]|uniref:Tyrosine-type recombinase/integrase n=1 Tax=Nocardia thailandica TaxID=257275 RepID=A0ABW6PK42_9NOCA
MVDQGYQVEPVVDRYLQELRFGRDRAESTTKAYAESIALFLRWCGTTGRQWQSAARDLGLFIVWLRYTGRDGSAVLAGPGVVPLRSDSRINKVLVATRGFLTFAVAAKEVPGWVLEQVYEVGDTRDLPVAVQGEDVGLRYRLRARHSLHQPQNPVDRASDREVVALFKACRSARDRLIVLLLARAGLRRGEATGLRRSDVHLLVDNAAHGCDVLGPHVHVVRRDNPNDAVAKSRNSRAVPLDFLVVRALELYLLERAERAEASGCDFLLVNLFRGVIGAPMKVGAVNELFETLCGRAGLVRAITPHQCRHGFASNLADSGALLDEIQALLGHAWPTSTQRYLHPSSDRLRAAVDLVPSPRELSEDLR